MGKTWSSPSEIGHFSWTFFRDTLTFFRDTLIKGKGLLECGAYFDLNVKQCELLEENTYLRLDSY